MKALVLVKLGGSLITDKDTPHQARHDVITKLAQEIHELIEAHTDRHFIIGNGSGSFGHYAAKQYPASSTNTLEQQRERFARVQQSAKELNSIVVEALLAAKVPAVSVHPSSMITTANGQVASIATEPLLNMLQSGVIPVLYGDILADSVAGSSIISTEAVFDAVCSELQRDYAIQSILYATSVDGVLDAQGQVIPLINPQNYHDFDDNFYATAGFDVTGGMQQKVAAGLEFVKKYQTEAYIVNGTIEHVLQRALAGEAIGTRLTAKA